MVAIAEPCRPTHLTLAHQRVGSGSFARVKSLEHGRNRNQQYSIIALADGGGAKFEQYVSGTVQTASASNDRYTYTGCEWVTGLSMYSFRTRMSDGEAVRSASRDPFACVGSKFDVFPFAESNPKPVGVA